MSDQHHISRHSDDEEEDLELLRLAALKSLHCKKESSIPSYHPSPAQTRNIEGSTVSSYSLPHLIADTYAKSTSLHSDTDNHVQSTYYSTEHSLTSHRSLTNILSNYDSIQRLEKLDINEPYVPQHLPSLNSTINPLSTNNGWASEVSLKNSSYVPYAPHEVVENVPIAVGNVQLSPRSLAFVVKNNDILMRRKGEIMSPNYTRSPCRSPCKSPLYRPFSPSSRSPSPTYRQSAGRWFLSPPKSKSRSPLLRNRSHPYSHRRSISRSPRPIRGRSPICRRRSLSRTPPISTSRNLSPYHPYSPRSPRQNHKRMKSKSPARLRNKVSPRRLSRSPITTSRHVRVQTKSPPSMNGRRSPVPITRHLNKNRLSPAHQRRSPGHGHDLNEARYLNRGRSPLKLVPNNAHSRSRSPLKKFSRRSRDRNVPSTQSTRRRSPCSNGRRKTEGASNGYRNRIRKRSPSPLSSNKRKTSRTRSPDRLRRDDSRNKRSERNSRKMDERSDKIRNEKRDEKVRNISTKPKATASNDGLVQESIGTCEKEEYPPPKQEDKHRSPPLTAAEKPDEKAENAQNEIEKKPAELCEEMNEEESSDDDDGIDLFPSDESESENEGRFKLGTSRKERDESVPTPSFTKLGESSVPYVIKDLKDIEASGGNKDSSGRDDRGRDDKGRSNYVSRRREDRFRKNDSSRNSRSERKRTNETSRSGSSVRRDRDNSAKSDEKRKELKPMFKSTFQAIENEDGKSNGKFSEEKDSIEKKGSIQIKKRLQKDERVSPDKQTGGDKLSSVVSTNSSCGSIGGGGGGAGTGVSGKKPIHLRLGAMTNMFKTPKKSSSWNPSDKV